MADAVVKPEIKLDPATDTPTNMADIEEFEEDTDLLIPPPPPEGPQAWLVKLPKYIWEAWADVYRNLPDDGPIEIGKMRVYETEEAADNPLKQQIQIRLNPGVPQHVELPKQYDLKITTNGYSNILAFSEKDLPGHRSQPFGRKSHLSAARPSGIQPKSERYGQVKPGTYRTAIPKQTALAPVIHHVADAAPVQDASYFSYFSKSYQNSLKPKKATTFTSGIDRGMHPGASNLTTFSSFGSLTSRPGGRRKKGPVKEKAVRISQEALLDALYQCFRRYRYWSLKALRTELKQPETFIKQTLESIATLVRSGDFAMNYVLKPEYASMAQINEGEVKEETAMVKSEDEMGVGVGETDDGVSGDEDGEGDGDEFEDVNMDGPT